MADKKVKLFNKMYREFQTSLLKSLKKSNDKVYNIKRQEQIDVFEKEMKQNLDFYTKKDEALFENVALLKRIFHGRPKLSNVNSVIVWKYISVLYTLSTGKKEEEIENTGEGMNDALKGIGLSSGQMKGVMNELVNTENKGLKNLVDDLSSQFSHIKDAKPQDIIDAIMNPGKKNSMGIDFKQILQNTSEKIASGEIDVSSITSVLNSAKKK